MREFYRAVTDVETGQITLKEGSICCVESNGFTTPPAVAFGFVRLNLTDGETDASNTVLRENASRILHAFGERERAIKVLANGDAHTIESATSLINSTESDSKTVKMLKKWYKKAQHAPYIFVPETPMDFTHLVTM